MFNCTERIKELEIENYKLKKQLEIAVDALKWIAYDENGEQDGLEEFAISQMMEKADEAINQITALEQKDHFADVSKMIEQKDVK